MCENLGEDVNLLLLHCPMALVCDGSYCIGLSSMGDDRHGQRSTVWLDFSKAGRRLRAWDVAGSTCTYVDYLERTI